MHTQMDKYQYYKVLIDASQFKDSIKECNIFSIGGKGYYENPTSDILAFFLDPSGEHGYRDLFITSLFEAAGYEPSIPISVSSVEREIATCTGSRIDLLVKSDAWSLVIENKIFHWLANPLSDYEKHIESNNGEKYFIVLSIQKEKPPPKWRSVTWQSYLNHIKKNLGYYVSQASNAKWHIIMREFIMNVESNYGSNSSSDERIHFVEEHYSLFNDLLKMKQEYLNYFAICGENRIRELTNDDSISVRSSIDNWENAKAIRLFSSKWGNRTNIACVLEDSGNIYLTRYVYDIPSDKVDNLIHYIDSARECTFGTESKTIRVFKDKAYYSNRESAINAVGKAAELLNKYYSEI